MTLGSPVATESLDPWFPYLLRLTSPPQGSAGEGCDWVDLRRHRDDASIRRPGQIASWPVVGPAASAPYRAFRLLMEGPNAAGGRDGTVAAKGGKNPGGSGAAGEVASEGRAAAIATTEAYNFGVSNIELYGYLYRLGDALHR